MTGLLRLKLTFVSLLVLGGLTLVLPAAVSAAARSDAGDGAGGGVLSSSWFGAGAAAAIFVPVGILVLAGLYFVVRSRNRSRDLAYEQPGTGIPVPIESGTQQTEKKAA